MGMPRSSCGTLGCSARGWWICLRRRICACVILQLDASQKSGASPVSALSLYMCFDAVPYSE